MKPPTRLRDVTSNLQGEKILASINPEDVAHIMAVLTDLYSDTEMASA